MVLFNCGLSSSDPIQGPAVSIKLEWVKKAISKMKSGKATGPSGIVEMLKASGKTCIDPVMELANSIVYEAVAPADWRSVLF